MAIRYFIYAVLLINFLIEPIINHFEFKKLEKEPKYRLRYYYLTIFGLWIPVFLIVLLILFYGVTLSDLGIKNIQLGANTLNIWFSYVIITCAALYFLIIIYHLICMKVSEQYRVAYDKKMKQSYTSEAAVDVMLPISDKEKTIWNIVSISAGVCEEILFRGFLLSIFSNFFPDLPTALIILSTSIVFGIWHAYQGFKGMLVTFLIGIFFSLLYLSIGSIIPVIILHILIDWSAKEVHTDSNI